MAAFEIFVHFEAVGRGEGNPDERPLTDIGREQAARMAEELMAAGPIDGVYANANARCRESVEPLAERLDTPVEDLHGFEPYAAPGEKDPLAPAFQAGSAFARLQEIMTGKPDGRFVLCTVGGDVISSLTALVAGINGSFIPPKLEVSTSAGGGLRRGNVYAVVLDGTSVSLKQREASAGFPQAT